MDNCKYCGSTKLIRDLHVSKSKDTALLGIPYKKSVFLDTEPFRIELCEECGSVNRIYVKNTDRKWVKSDE